MTSTTYVTTYVIRDGVLIDKTDAAPLHSEASRAPGYISDHMDPTRHMADGRLYDSKSEFRKATKAAGCVEVGNERLKPFAPPKLDRAERAMDIKRAIYELTGKA
jgi:hypothetical protein